MYIFINHYIIKVRAEKNTNLKHLAYFHQYRLCGYTLSAIICQGVSISAPIYIIRKKKTNSYLYFIYIHLYIFIYLYDMDEMKITQTSKEHTGRTVIGTFPNL